MPRISSAFLSLEAYSNYHPASRASFISVCFIFHYSEKEALHKSGLSFEVAVAPTLGLVIPVYCRQTGFSSASINFYEKPMVETEPTGCKKNMAVKGPGQDIVRKRLTILCVVSIFKNVHDSRKYQPASIKYFTSGQILSYLFRSRSQELQKHSEL